MPEPLGFDPVAQLRNAVSLRDIFLFAAFPPTFRTMSQAHYDELLKTGRLPATAETFVSPTRAFAANYDGVLVQFNMKPGTLQAIEGLGVRDASALTTRAYRDMPLVSKGWANTHIFFKGEGAQINLGLGRGQGLETCNSLIQGFERLP